MKKRWQFVAIVHPEGFVAAAIARIGPWGYAFAYAQDRRHGVPGPHLEPFAPLGLGMLVSSEAEGWSRLSSPGLIVGFEPQSGAFRIHSSRLQPDATVAHSIPWDAEWPHPLGLPLAPSSPSLLVPPHRGAQEGSPLGDPSWRSKMTL